MVVDSSLNNILSSFKSRVENEQLIKRTVNCVNLIHIWADGHKDDRNLHSVSQR